MMKPPVAFGMGSFLTSRLAQLVLTVLGTTHHRLRGTCDMHFARPLTTVDIADSCSKHISATMCEAHSHNGNSDTRTSQWEEQRARPHHQVPP
ncbi:hypothetical protein DE146DRAFT_176184 [Phaeosphaeria sp. MPI-PUGE-AT-0046c]|nr:hypothetical protein DE146DRAFT_176184 [Phaeosphaeria sp. MPI-PUGE-AT-0046c]